LRSKKLGLSVLIILIAISILVALVFLIGFLWSVNSGQYEDDYTPSVRILFEDNAKESKSEKSKQQNAGRKVSLRQHNG